MKINDDLHVEWVDGEAVVLDGGSGELHYLNGTAATVFALIGEYGWPQAQEELESRFGQSPDFKEELQDLLKDMTEKGLLIEA